MTWMEGLGCWTAWVLRRVSSRGLHLTPARWRWGQRHCPERKKRSYRTPSSSLDAMLSMATVPRATDDASPGNAPDVAITERSSVHVPDRVTPSMRADGTHGGRRGSRRTSFSARGLADVPNAFAPECGAILDSHSVVERPPPHICNPSSRSWPRRKKSPTDPLLRSSQSGRVKPEPPISAGMSFIFGSPSFIRSFVSW